MKTLVTAWPWLAAICSGLLYAACFAPFNLTWFCWIALTPLIAAIWFSGTESRHAWLRNLLLGYVAGLTFFWIVFSWLTTVTVLGWFVLEFYMAIYFAIWAWFCGLLRPRAGKRQSPGASKWDQMLVQARRTAPPAQSPWTKSTSNLRLAFILAAAWTTLEWLRGWVFSGFGWNGLGVALHGNWPLIQTTELTGVAGLSFMVAFVNVIVLTTAYRLVVEARTRVMRPHFDFTVTMAAIVGVLIFGLRATQISPPTKPLRVAAVQSNVPQNQKFDPQFTRRIFDQFRRLSEIALRSNPPPDLLVWPESSMPGPVLADEESYKFVMDLAASADTDLLLGTIDVDKRDVYNAALLVSDGGEHVQIYRKVHLVPFGEYVPGRHTVPLLAQIVGDQVPGDFKEGQEHTVFTLTNTEVRVAPLICFEDTIGELTRQFVLPNEASPGANLLVDVTNDGWFQRSAGSHQHLANAIFRCVETRRPMIRAANTGVTCFINQFGRVTQVLQDDTGSTFTEGVLAGEIKVPTELELTFYARHGELFAKACAAITVVSILYFSARVVGNACRGVRRGERLGLGGWHSRRYNWQKFPQCDTRPRMRVQLPLDHLPELWPNKFRGARIGALVHPASVSSNLEHASRILERHSGDLFRLAAFFGPQHGFLGQTQDNMVEWKSYEHPRLHIPVHSLYGDHREPTAEMLEGLDVLLVDLQDVGSRYYTFVWTLYLSMRACERCGIAVVVLDRPNPINGVTTEGPVLDPNYESFVGMHPIPVRHGRTIGELAQQFRDEAFPKCELSVLPMKNWERAMWFDQTGLPWVMPSPNMPTLETATVYPGMCLFEGTNISEGRGTMRPFEIFGAPFIDAEKLCAELNALKLPGVFFRKNYFQPTFQKFAGQLCSGAQLHVVDRNSFRPFETGIEIIRAIRSWYPDQFEWKQPPYEYEREKLPIEILLGGPVKRFFDGDD